MILASLEDQLNATVSSSAALFGASKELRVGPSWLSNLNWAIRRDRFADDRILAMFDPARPELVSPTVRDQARSALSGILGLGRGFLTGYSYIGADDRFLSGAPSGGVLSFERTGLFLKTGGAIGSATVYLGESGQVALFQSRYVERLPVDRLYTDAAQAVFLNAPTIAEATVLIRALSWADRPADSEVAQSILALGGLV